MDKGSFVVAMRGPSSTCFQPNDSIPIERFLTNSGEVNFLFRTRYEDVGSMVPVPCGLGLMPEEVLKGRVQ